MSQPPLQPPPKHMSHAERRQAGLTPPSPTVQVNVKDLAKSISLPNFSGTRRVFVERYTANGPDFGDSKGPSGRRKAIDTLDKCVCPEPHGRNCPRLVCGNCLTAGHPSYACPEQDGTRATNDSEDPRFQSTMFRLTATSTSRVVKAQRCPQCFKIGNHYCRGTSAILKQSVYPPPSPPSPPPPHTPVTTSASASPKDRNGAGVSSSGSPPSRKAKDIQPQPKESTTTIKCNHEPGIAFVGGRIRSPKERRQEHGSTPTKREAPAPSSSPRDRSSANTPPSRGGGREGESQGKRRRREADGSPETESSDRRNGDGRGGKLRLHVHNGQHAPRRPKPHRSSHQ